MTRHEPLPPSASASPGAAIRAGSGVRDRFAAGNLAHVPTRFVGRRRELSELRTLLTEHALVTVVGPAGVGKSRLAAELARLLVDEYAQEGGTWRVDLSEARDADAVRAAMGRTLRLGAAATAGTALSARGRTLVILDGADGCAGPLGRLLPSWLDRAPAVRWIVTAGAPLNVDAEGLLDLGPLAIKALGGGAPDAVWLFVDRARVAKRDLALDDRAEQDISALVRRLDGVPLAIELAAARAHAVRLDRMLDERRMDLAGVIDATWRQLGAWQKDALAQLSVFAGGFDVEAAQAVLDLRAHAGAPPAAEALDSLRRRALIGVSSAADDPGHLRFAMPAAVRRNARERLVDLGARDGAIARHARHYVETARAWSERYEQGQARDAIAWLAREADNLLAVQQRALSRGSDALTAVEAAVLLDPLLEAFGPPSLRLSLLDAAARLAEERGASPELHVRTLLARSDARRALGKLRESASDAQAALSIATEAGARAAIGRILRTLATLAVVEGKTAEARGLAERACAVDREAGQRREEGRALGLLGGVAALEGRLDAARSTLERAVAVHRELADLRYEAIDTGDLAVVAHAAGKIAEARLHGERALELCREAGDRAREADVLGLLAALAHEQDRADEARDLYAHAAQMQRESGNARAEAVLLGRHAVLRAELDDVDGARAACARALAVLREHRDRPGEALVLGALAGVEARDGCLDSARAALAHATEALEGLDESRVREVVELWRGHLDLELALRARSEGDEARATMLAEAAACRLPTAEPAESDVRRAADVRLARRALLRALDAARRGAASGARDAAALPVDAPPPDAPADALVVCAHGRWFRTPGADVVSVARWRPLQRLLERLAERREVSPGEPLPVEALVAAGWPGERVLPKAGATRVYTAIASLRRLGLRDVLLREAGGYLLRPEIPIARVSRG